MAERTAQQPRIQPERYTNRWRSTVILVPMVGVVLSLLVSFYLLFNLLESNKSQLYNQINAITKSYQDRLNGINSITSSLRAYVSQSDDVRQSGFNQIYKSMNPQEQTVLGAFWLLRDGNDFHVFRYSDIGANLNKIEESFNQNSSLRAVQAETADDKIGIILNLPGSMFGITEKQVSLVLLRANNSANMEGYVVLLVQQMFPVALNSNTPGILDMTVNLKTRVGMTTLYHEKNDGGPTWLPQTYPTRTLNFRNQAWQLKFTAIETGVTPGMFAMPIFILLAGFGFTFALTSSVVVTQRRAAKIANLASSIDKTNKELKSRIEERDKIAETLRNNDREFRAVINGVNDVIFETNSLGTLAFVNASWTALTGFDIRETLTKSLFDFVQDADRQTLQNHFNNVLSGEESNRRHEVRLLRKTGGFRLVEISLRSLRRAGYATVRVVGMMTDVSERRRQEAQLREAEQKYRAMVENSVAGFFQATPDGRYISVNPAFSHIMGYDSPAELVNMIKDIRDDVYLDGSNWDTFVNQLAEEGAITEHEARVRRKDAAIIWVAINARAVRDEEGQVLYYDGTLEHVTRRKEAEIDLRSAMEQADMANRAKSEFLANMSHELRTPLNAIIGFSEIIRDEMFGPVERRDYVEYARDIHGSGTHLLELINDILDVSKIEAGKKELNENLFDLGRVSKSCLDLVKTRAENGKLTLINDVPTNLPPIYGEELAIKQVIVNLLSNAVKFTPEGGKVVLSAYLESDGRLRIWVSDSGIGIRQEDIAKVLIPFGQVDSSFARRYAGTGLGLTLVISLVELHGGEFKLESVFGKGTDASFWLPAERIITSNYDTLLKKELAAP